MLYEVIASYPPSLVTSNKKIISLKEKFDSTKEPFGGEFYTTPESINPWTETKFDVDSDQIDERILTANTAMNHTPNDVVIVKDGFIVFKYQGASVNISKAGDSNGFFLHETIDWNNGEYRVTRYTYNKGKFTPIWYQTSCAVRPQSN